METTEISAKIVWLKRFRIAWLSRKDWGRLRKRNWWLSYCKHKHWRTHGGVSDIYAHSYQVSILGLNIAYKKEI